MARIKTIPDARQSKQLRYYHKKKKKEEARASLGIPKPKKRYPWSEEDSRKAAARRLQSKTDPRTYIRAAFAQKKHRAKEVNLPFELDDAWLDLQPMQCAITGKQFVIPPAGTGPLSPSFDQKIAGAGYTKENTQLVCLWVNGAKNRWPEAEICALIVEAAEVLKR